MYAPGVEPVVFDVDGVRVGLVLGLEVLFPDFFVDYADRGVDLIIAASNAGGAFEQLVCSFATITGVPIALAIPAAARETSAGGVYAWNGPVAVVDDKSAAQTLVTTVTSREDAETFHFKARHGFYDPHLAHEEPRTRTRTTF
jgi:predicted amidohydrolase